MQIIYAVFFHNEAVIILPLDVKSASAGIGKAADGQRDILSGLCCRNCKLIPISAVQREADGISVVQFGRRYIVWFLRVVFIFTQHKPHSPRLTLFQGIIVHSDSILSGLLYA